MPASTILNRKEKPKEMPRNSFVSVWDTLIPQGIAEEALDAASCIGSGACVANCKNASAALFTGAKVSHLSLLPQGRSQNTGT